MYVGVNPACCYLVQEIVLIGVDMDWPAIEALLDA